MEEGGALGFYAIEALSHVEACASRAARCHGAAVPAAQRRGGCYVLFVYEVARIMFLDVAEVSGRGGSHHGQSSPSPRKPTGEGAQFLLHGFRRPIHVVGSVGHPDLWDSINLLEGPVAGAGKTPCVRWLRKTPEALTWMLASGGQVAFLVIWVRSLSIGNRIHEVS